MLHDLKERLTGGGQHTPGVNGNESSNRNMSSSGHSKPHEDSPPTPVGFWDPSLKHVRRRAVGKWLLTTAFLMAFILAVLSIYWGVFFQVQQRLHHLLIYVVDFDGQAPYNTNQPLVGPTIVRLAQQMVRAGEAGQTTLGWNFHSPQEFNNDPMQVRQAVYDFHAWAAIIINPNATSLLYSAIQTGNTSYDPLGACQLVFMDSRDETNWYDFILPIISTFMTDAQSEVGRAWAQIALNDASNPATLRNIQAVPQAINPAIGFSQYNLRPLYPYTGIPAVSIGLIYLIIISFFSFSFYLPIHVQFIRPKGHPPLKFYQLIIWRWFATMSAYFFLSLAYSLVSLAMQINFTTTNPITSDTQVTDIAYRNAPAYGHGTFPVYWMLNFFGMIALGLACENVAMLVGAPWMGLWLIFWVITNVATAFYDIEIAPEFYRWGYAWPLHSGMCCYWSLQAISLVANRYVVVVEGSRQILFDLHSRIGLDFGILIAWGAVNTTFFPICCWFQRKSPRSSGDLTKLIL